MVDRALKPKNPHYLWLLRPFFKKSLMPLALGSISGVLMNTLVVLPAVLLGRAVDTVLALERGQASASQAGWAAAAFLGGTLATQLPRLGKRWWLMTANAHIRANIRAAALRGVLAWPMERLYGHTIGELMARITGDVEVLGIGIHDFSVETWDTLLFTLSVVTAMAFYDPALAAAALLPAPLALLLMQALRTRVELRTREARQANASLTSTLQEYLSAVRLLRLAGRRETAGKKIEALSEQASRVNFQLIQLREGLQPVYSFLLMAGAVLAIALGGQRVASGALSVGAFVGFMDLFLRFTSRAYRIPRLFNTIQSGGVAYQRLLPLLDQAGTEKTAQGTAAAGSKAHGQQIINPDAAQGPLAAGLHRVQFTYPQTTRPALNRVSLEIPAGAFVAITGPVGSGKSALLRLILGLYEPDEGEVWLGGAPATPARRSLLAGRIGYLAQEPYLFSGAIGENIAFGPPDAVDPGRVTQAVRTALLEPDLHKLEAGLATPVGEAGGQVSGGQRQRIALARSLAATPAPPGLLLLDDPFSAVDLDTEVRLIQSLREVFGPGAAPEQRATIVLCSHRLAAFPQADQIYILDGGRICESGTHTQLMVKGGIYSRLFNAQAAHSHPVLPEHISHPGETRPEQAP